MRSYEQVYNTIWVLIAAGICVESARLGIWDAAQGPVAGFIPFLSGVLIGIPGAAMLVLGFRSREKKSRPAEKFWPERGATVRIVFILCGLAAMAFLMPRIGFLITAIVITTFMLRVLEPQGWLRVVLTSFGCCLLVYWLFTKVLQVSLPRGFLGI